jgi:hypothetical protein
MRRREFIALLSGATVAGQLTARAQQAAAIPTVGVLWHSGNAGEEQPYFDTLMRGFKDLGYIEGRNIKFEHRFPNETPDRFRDMAAELVALKVNVIVTVGTLPPLTPRTRRQRYQLYFCSLPIRSGWNWWTAWLGRAETSRDCPSCRPI